MFTNYIDDSGTDPNQRVAIASGLVVPTARIDALGREWDALKLKEGFTDFHTSVFSAQNKRSDFADWSLDKHDRVFLRVRQIAKKYGVKTYTFAVKKTDYDEVVPTELKKYWGDFHYTWAVRQFVDYFYNWEPRLTGAPLEWVFDYMEPSHACRKEIEKVMEQAEDMTGNTGKFTNHSFRRRELVPGLQCADVLAWTSYQSVLREFFGRPLVRDAEIAWVDFAGHLAGKWREVRTVSRVNLQDAVRKEQETGRSVAQFKGMGR